MNCGIKLNLLTDLKEPVAALRDSFPQDSQKAAVQANRAYFETFLKSMTFAKCTDNKCPSTVNGTAEYLHITSDPSNFGFAVKKTNETDFTGAQIKCAMTERPCTPATNATAAADPNETVNTISCQANNANTKTFPYTYDEISHKETIIGKTEFLNAQAVIDHGRGLGAISVKTGLLGLGLGGKFTGDIAKDIGQFKLNIHGIELGFPQESMAPVPPEDATKAEIKAAKVARDAQIAELLKDASMLDLFMTKMKNNIRQTEVPSEFYNWAYPAIGTAALASLFCGYKTVQAAQKIMNATPASKVTVTEEQKAKKEALLYGAATIVSICLGGYAFFNASHCPAGATADMGKCYTWQVNLV